VGQESRSTVHHRGSWVPSLSNSYAEITSWQQTSQHLKGYAWTDWQWHVAWTQLHIQSHALLRTCHLPAYGCVFVEDINKLFDSFNTVKCAPPGKTLHSPLTDNSPQVGHWTKASMGIKSWVFLSGMPYKWCQFGCDRSILKGTLTWRTVLSQLYIGFHSRHYPQTP